MSPKLHFKNPNLFWFFAICEVVLVVQFLFYLSVYQTSKIYIYIQASVKRLSNAINRKSDIQSK